MSAKAIKIQDKIPKQNPCLNCKTLFTSRNGKGLFCKPKCGKEYLQKIETKIKKHEETKEITSITKRL